jgi:phenylacetate-coenzyme A ligase PaaK-like adenylate-forming protein
MSHHTAVYDAWQTACAYADSLTASHASAATWREHRALRLAELLQQAERGSRLYRERLREAGYEAGADAWTALQRMKPVSKRELMRRFDDWVSDPALDLPSLQAFVRERGRRGQAYRDRYLVWESSGSGGEPGVFVQDERALAVADALEAARGPVSLAGAGGLWPELWGSSGWALQRIAFVGALEGHFAAVVAFERARELNPWLNASSHSFSFLQPMSQLVAQLNDFAPTVLASYPSMAWVLSQQQRGGRLRIEPHAIWTGGETLTPAVRRTLSERFHAPVRDCYGASECFIMANECRCGRLHLNADWVILEPVDEHGQPVPDGQFGATTLLTNLANHVQPIIRYDLGDRVRFVPGACACGSSLPLIEVQGRADDVLTLHDDTGHEVHLAPLALTTVLEDEGGVFDFQLRQRGPRALELDVFEADATDDHAHSARRALREFLREQGLKSTRVQCHREATPAARGRSGKQRRVVCDAHAMAAGTR